MNPYVCADCGHEQDSMDRRCDKCNSPRVISIAVAQDLFGDDWRDAFRKEEDRKIMEHWNYPLTRREDK